MAAEHNGRICAQQLADILPVGVAILNDRDKFVFVNRRFQELTTRNMPTAFDCLSHSIHPEDYDRVATDYYEASDSKTAIRMEYRIAGHTEAWRALTLAPLDDVATEQFGLRENGGFITILTDITLEKMAELSQRKIARDARERKQQQERFIDMISHEVRNPLSAILHCAEDIVEALQDWSKSETQISKITQAAETISLCVAHQKKIIDDVLIFSKLDAFMLTLSPREVQPKRHLATLLSMFRPELRKRKIEFEYILDQSYTSCGIDWVMADIDRVGQVLINLVSNAIKFTADAKDERKIRVSMGASRQRPPSYPPNVVFFKPSEAELELDESARPEWGNGQVAFIMVAVKDTGVGISDQHQKRLFERFNQATPRTDRIYGGFGLGLNISRRLCHMHGGEIGVSSKEGHGSTFGFFFTVRQCREALNSAGDAKEELKSDQIFNQIYELGELVSNVPGKPISPEIPRSPSVTSVQEVAPNAPSDDRKEHTARIVRDVEGAQKMPKNEPNRPVPNLINQTHSKSPPKVKSKSEPVEGRRILLVEDNIINQQIVSRRLRSSGFQVIEASNGLEALDAWRRDKFDCILMDQEMPVMDGKSATRAIRALEKNSGTSVPIMGVTANVRHEQQAEMLDAGMNDILHKPYRMQDLCANINQMTFATN